MSYNLRIPPLKKMHLEHWETLSTKKTKATDQKVQSTSQLSIKSSDITQEISSSKRSGLFLKDRNFTQPKNFSSQKGESQDSFLRLAKEITERVSKENYNGSDNRIKHEKFFKNACEIVLNSSYQISSHEVNFLIRLAPNWKCLDLFFSNLPTRFRNTHFYSALLFHAKEGGEFFKIGKAAFNEALKSKQIDSFIVGAYLETLLCLNRFDLELFNNFKEYCKPVTFSHLICKSRDYELARSIFNSLEKKEIDAGVLRDFINMAYKHSQLKDAHEAFLKADSAIKNIYVYMAYIPMALAVSDQHGEEIFQEGTRLLNGDPRLYATYIHWLAKKGKQESVKRVYEAVKNTPSASLDVHNNLFAIIPPVYAVEELRSLFNGISQPDAYTVSSYMRAMEYYGRFDLIEEGFYRGRKEGKGYSPHNDTLYIILAGKFFEYKKAFSFFETIWQKHDTFHYNACLEVAKNARDRKYVEWLFNHVKNPDAVTYNTYFQAMETLGDLDSLKRAKERCIGNRLFGTAVSATYILSASRMKQFSEAISVYQNAPECSIIMLNSLIKGARKNAYYQNLREYFFNTVKMEFWKAVKNETVDTVTFLEYIKTAKKYGKHDEVEQAFHFAKQHSSQLQLNLNHVLNQYIAYTASDVTKILAEAEMDQLTDEITFCSYIKHLTDANQFEKVETGFHTAVQKFPSYTALYNSYLTMHRKKGCNKTIFLNIFKLLKLNKVPFDQTTYSLVVQLATQVNEFLLGKGLYEEALKKVPCSELSIIYSAGIDLFSRSGDSLKAKEIFNQHILPSCVLPSVQNPKIDLHGYSHIEAQYYLEYTLSVTEVNKLNVVTGKGLHAVEKGKMKAHILEWIQQSGSKWQMTDEHEGDIHLTRVTLPTRF